MSKFKKQIFLINYLFLLIVGILKKLVRMTETIQSIYLLHHTSLLVVAHESHETFYAEKRCFL